MKREELEALGLNKEQIDKVLGIHHREHDPVKKELEAAQGELRAEKEKTSTQEAVIKDLKKNLVEFKDADVGGMREKIETLEADIRAKEESYQKEIADRDFNDLLQEGITLNKKKKLEKHEREFLNNNPGMVRLEKRKTAEELEQEAKYKALWNEVLG